MFNDHTSVHMRQCFYHYFGSGDSVLFQKMHNSFPYHITVKTWIARKFCQCRRNSLKAFIICSGYHYFNCHLLLLIVLETKSLIPIVPLLISVFCPIAVCFPVGNPCWSFGLHLLPAGQLLLSFIHCLLCICVFQCYNLWML